MLKVDGATTNILVATALVLATPFFIFFGWLSDRIGRKWIILAGCLIAALTYLPLFETLTRTANPGLRGAWPAQPVTVVADPGQCSFQFDPVGKAVFDSSCDVAKGYLAKAGVPYQQHRRAGGGAGQGHDRRRPRDRLDRRRQDGQEGLQGAPARPGASASARR